MVNQRISVVHTTSCKPARNGVGMASVRLEHGPSHVGADSVACCPCTKIKEACISST